MHATTAVHTAEVQRKKWETVRVDLVSHLLGEGVPSVGGDIASCVTKFEWHPLSVQDLGDVLSRLKASSAWSTAEVASFEFELPVPDLDGLRTNAWSLRVAFAYSSRKRVFKVEMFRQSLKSLHVMETYDDSRWFLCFRRSDTDLSDFKSRRFLYRLRDKMGVWLKRMQRPMVCGSVVKSWNERYDVLCGENVRVQGAMCYHCRSLSLKRKFEL